MEINGIDSGAAAVVAGGGPMARKALDIQKEEGESAVKLIKSSDEGPEKKGEMVDTTA